MFYVLSIFDYFYIFIQMWCYFPWSIMIVKHLLWLDDARLYSDKFLEDRENEKKRDENRIRAKHSLPKGPENNIPVCHIAALYFLWRYICKITSKCKLLDFLYTYMFIFNSILTYFWKKSSPPRLIGWKHAVWEFCFSVLWTNAQ